MEKSERAKKMQENFLVDRQNGMTIAEIAKKYQISRTTVYRDLTQIAKENKIKGGREELLSEIHKTPAYWERQKETLKISTDEISLALDKAHKEILQAQNIISDLITKIEEKEQ